MRAPCGLTLAVAVTIGLAPVGAQAQESRSAEPSRVLTQLLDARGADAIAARDPADPRRFIAALYFPGSQLLVVSHAYPVPVLLEQRLARGEYRDIYVELQGTVSPEGRFFVHDMGANGLRPTCDPGDPFDIVYESGQPYAAFNGDCAGQHLTEPEYASRFDIADHRYARMLAILVSALRPET